MHMECTQPEEIHTSVMHYFNTMSTLWDIVGVDVCIAVRTFLEKCDCLSGFESYAFVSHSKHKGCKEGKPI